MKKTNLISALMLVLVLIGTGMIFTADAQARKSDKPAKPNILVIMGDDIGIFNVSTYNMGMMG